MTVGRTVASAYLARKLTARETAKPAPRKKKHNTGTSQNRSRSEVGALDLDGGQASRGDNERFRHPDSGSSERQDRSLKSEDPVGLVADLGSQGLIQSLRFS